MTTDTIPANPSARPEPIPSRGDLIIDLEDAVQRIDGLLEAAFALDWDRPTLHDGSAINAIIASALMQVDMAHTALKKLRAASVVPKETTDRLTKLEEMTAEVFAARMRGEAAQ